MTSEKNGTALARVEPSAALAMIGTPTEAEERLRELQEFIHNVMKEGADYGKIPGTDKDTLFQPGAQKLSEIYGLAPSFDDARAPIERWGDDGTEPLFAYFKRCRLVRKSDGVFVGEGIGSCNSREEKYAGRWVFSSDVPPELDVSRLRKREGISKKNGKPYTMYRIPNPAIFDLVNTIEKMAAKRALVMAVIGATRSAGIFTQDLEDMSPDARQGKAAKPEATDAEYEDAPRNGARSPATPARIHTSPDIVRERARWADDGGDENTERTLEGSPDPNDRALVYAWRIDNAESLDALDKVATAIGADPHEVMRTEMLGRAEKRRAEMAQRVAA